VRGFSGRWKEQMDTKTALQRVGSAGVGHLHRSLSLRGPTIELNRAETLILVSLLSLGLWALIWAVVSLLASYALR
jgi:hypothetical protein